MDDQEYRVATATVIDGKYTLGRVIGSGGMGTVYEATKKGLERKVALKLLNSKYAQSTKIVERFHQEARLAGSINHDNICPVTDHGTAENGAPYLVMPLLSGQSLAGLLEAEEKPSQMRIIDIACQTLMALAAAHAEKIVHRDLKPDNIFVTQMGDREDFVKLLDFGISKVMEGESISTLTSTGMVLGTAYYLAPEQAKGAKKIDHRVDIYAMGVILYEALTGRRPFEGETYNEVMFKIAGDPFKPPRSLNPAIPPSVEQVILQAMAIDPNDRFASAAKMARALEEAVVNAPSHVGASITDTLADTAAHSGMPGPALYRRAGHIRLRRVWIALLLTAVAAGLFAFGIWLFDDTANNRDGDQGLKAPTAASAPVSKSTAVEKGGGEHQIPSPRKAAVAPASTESQPAPAASAPPASANSSADARAASREKSPKRVKKRATEKKEVIKGPFGTTFVFEK